MVKYQVNTTLAAAWMTAFETTRAFARASSGRYWVTYVDNINWIPGYNLWAAYSDDGITWVEELVFGPSQLFRSGDKLHLVVDSLGIPHILFTFSPIPFGNNRYLMHTDRAGGTWAVPEIAYDAGIGTNIVWHSVCIDNLDVIHAALDRSLDERIYHIYGTTGVWNNEIVYNSPNGIGSNTEIATDSANNIFIVWAESIAPNRILCIYRTGGIWQAPEIVSLNYGWAFVVSFDLLDNLHVAWLTAPTGPAWCIQYCKRSPLPGGWGPEVNAVHEFDGIVSLLPPTITVDSDGNAYIIFQKDDHGGDEAVYYKRVSAAGVLGPIEVMDATILMPNAYNSVFASLWSGGSDFSILNPSFYPMVVLLDEDVSLGFPYAKVWFEAASLVTVPTVITEVATGVT